MTNINELKRQEWVRFQLENTESGKSVLDVGAGECQYKKYCNHLNYKAQDIAKYDGVGDQAGLQTGKWDFSEIDIACDILDIEESVLYDVILCTEVLEHVPDPVKVLEKISRLTKPDGEIIVTAPFSSLTHFAPFHYSSGFSSYFYQHHLERLNFDIQEIVPNGGFFDYVEQEVSRSTRVSKKYLGAQFNFIERKVLSATRYILKKYARRDVTLSNPSSELLTFGWHVHAKKRSVISTSTNE